MQNKGQKHKTNNIDRPTKHSLPLTKLTNFSSEWIVGLFCRLKNICAVKYFMFLVLEKIIDFKFVYEVCIY